MEARRSVRGAGQARAQRALSQRPTNSSSQHHTSKAALKSTVFIVIGALVLLLGWWLWTPDKDRALLERSYLRAAEDMIEIAGVHLHVRDSGPRHAPVVIFLHGFGASLHTWVGPPHFPATGVSYGSTCQAQDSARPTRPATTAMPAALNCCWR